MSGWMLTSDEWAEINRNLPDVRGVINHVMENWPQMEWIGFDETHNTEVVKRLRASYVRFYSAVEHLRRSRYALGQAVGVRKYYRDRSVKERDANHASSEFYSHFYADYVPLLIHAAGEQARIGLIELYGYVEELGKVRGAYPLKRTLTLFESKHPNSNIANALSEFDNSISRNANHEYRNAWFHDKPIRVKTDLYDPPYDKDGFISKQGQWEIVTLGVRQPPKYTWNDFIAMLRSALTDTSKFIEKCLNEWDHSYNP